MIEFYSFLPIFFLTIQIRVMKAGEHTYELDEKSELRNS